MLEVGIIKKKEVQNSSLTLRNLKLVRERPISKWQKNSSWIAQTNEEEDGHG